MARPSGGKSSGIQLIQELRSDSFSLAQAAPLGDGDKVMRLRAQTAKIEGGFVLFPKAAPWLDAYLLELTTFPNSKNDDQVDSTVGALAWSTQEANKPGMGIFYYYKAGARAREPGATKVMTRVKVPGGSSHWILISGREVPIPADRIIEVDEEELPSILRNGGQKVA